MKKGISLITLIITIVVIIILAAAVILTIANNNPIANAKKAREMSDEATREEELRIKQLSSVLLPEWNGSVADSLSGSGTENDPYLISNGSDLAKFSELVNGGEYTACAKLTKSINMGNKEFPMIAKGITGVMSETASDWGSFSSLAFNGTIDGDNNVITGIAVNEKDLNGVGFIGALGENGVIKNLNLYQGTIIGKAFVGGIAGISKGSIINCTNSMTIIAQDDVNHVASGEMAGGIIGYALLGEVVSCNNYGNVTTKDDSLLTGRGKEAGGIIGCMEITDEDFLIDKCNNYGTIIATYQLSGGIVAAIESRTTKKVTIQNCKNFGEVRTEDNVLNNQSSGGIVAWNGSKAEVEIKKCANNGNVNSAEHCAGGIISTTSSNTSITNISDCYNIGNVEADGNAAGGIVGVSNSNSNCNIINCYNTGSITSKVQQAAGIAGKMVTGTVSNCYNAGKIMSGGNGARSIAGGIVGWLNGVTTVSNVYNIGNVGLIDDFKTKLDIVGGIIGLKNGGTLEKAYNKGEVTGFTLTGDAGPDENDAVGAIIGYPKAGEVSKSYFYSTSNINAIGSTTDSVDITPISENDNAKKVTDNIASYEEFLEWIKNI